MTEPLELIPATKHCPICSQELPLTDYGVCRARKDGRNLYCKSCIRKKVSDSRKAFKAYKSVRHQYVIEKLDGEGDSGAVAPRRQAVMRPLSKLTPTERVREAIRSGAKTQKEIRKRAKLGDDEVGDALANLLLWTREIRTEVVDNNRQYFINQPTPELDARYKKPAPQLPPRKRDVTSSFSAVEGLMPGKKTEGGPEKVPGWVAA